MRTTTYGRLGAIVALGALMLVVPDADAAAQTPERPTSAVELGIGPAAGQGTGVGGHLTAAYVTAPTHFGLAIRLEGTLTTWRSLGDLGTATGGRLSNVGVNLVQTLSRGALQPYVTAGTAAYLRQGDGPAWGLNAGAGLRFPVRSASLFTEARLHRTRDDYAYRLYSLTFGIRF